MELQEVKNNAEFDKILADYSRWVTVNLFYIHVESINLKTKPVKIVQSYNDFIERQGKGLETYPAEERIEEHSSY